MRYTTALYREGSPMKFMVFLLFWYGMAFGIFLLQVWLNGRGAGKSPRPQAPLMTLKEGETIIGVADRPGARRFYIGDVVDEKRYD
jgi:hypothetical protein